MSGWMCVGRKTGARIGKIWAKGQNKMAKTRESICERMENCNKLNRCS